MKRPFYKTKKFIVPIIVMFIIGGGWLLVKSARAKSEAKRIAELSPVKPVRGVLVMKTQAAGNVEPENRVLVTPSVSGRAEEVLFTEGQVVDKGQIMAWISSSERTALLDSLKMKESTPGEKKMVEEAYNLAPVVAPIAGMVVKRSVEPGQSVSAAKELAVISDRLIVKTFVDETDIGSVKEGQRADFYLDAFPKDRHEGRVLAISHESSLKDGVIVYEVKILPVGSIAVMRSGMTADVLVITGSKSNVMTIPKKSVKYRDGDALVSVKDSPAGKLTEKKIAVGATNESAIEVLSGLSDTDTVYYSTGIAKESSGFNVSH
ncbi:MAG: HlyD family efflux transporter periplasmic adaptor subunit [Elusimicrobiota bacterium]|nr:HlyD family efflux transporter periplasmic adaptor subunit [Elusimicrobiota bacterium]